MTDPRDAGDPQAVKRSRWWIWVVAAIALAIILVLALGKNLGGGEPGPTRVDSAQGTAADAQTGAPVNQPGASLAEGGAAQGAAGPAAGTSAYGADGGVTAPGTAPEGAAQGASPSQ